MSWKDIGLRKEGDFLALTGIKKRRRYRKEFEENTPEIVQPGNVSVDRLRGTMLGSKPKIDAEKTVEEERITSNHISTDGKIILAFAAVFIAILTFSLCLS